MSAEVDLYAVLGVPRSASTAEIRTAYRALVGKFHPDKHVGNPLADLASEKLAELNHAYEVLSDPSRRAQYDAGLPPSRPLVQAPRPARMMRSLWPLLLLALAFILVPRFAGRLLARPWLVLLVIGAVLLAGRRFGWWGGGRGGKK